MLDVERERKESEGACGCESVLAAKKRAALCLAVRVQLAGGDPSSDSGIGQGVITRSTGLRTRQVESTKPLSLCATMECICFDRML